MISGFAIIFGDLKPFGAIFLTYSTGVDGRNKVISDCIPQVIIHLNYGETYNIQPKHSYWSNIRAYVKKRKTKCK